MKPAASQIAWQPEEEHEALAILRECGFAGLEIAPTRVAGPQPYERPEAAAAFARALRDEWGFSVCSMQSIWYGVSGSIFGPERAMLLDYTKKAIAFAREAACPNLVFGCPKNRVLPQGGDAGEAIPFFKELGDYAVENGVVISLEANPPLYGTNFINTTLQALEMAKRVGSGGFKVNLDFGTIVENKENVRQLHGRVAALGHVHISEPNLAMIKPREEHWQLAELLREEGYGGYVSIEMKAAPLAQLREAAVYVAEVFG